MSKTLDDAQLDALLNRTVDIAEPILTLLRSADPLTLKPRTFPIVDFSGPAGTAARALNAVDWPGTAGWAELSMNERADWWVQRIGALNTVAVAFPGMFGMWTKKLPAATFLGAADQALIVLAVGGEYGIVDRPDEIALLSGVLLGRPLDVQAIDRHRVTETPPASDGNLVWTAIKGVWKLARTLRKLEHTLEARPTPPKALSRLGWLPLIGGPAGYAGELIALRTAVRTAQRWIAENRQAIEPATVEV